MKRIGVFGGTFDPVHNGHLALATEVRWALDLEQVLFVVAAWQPLKLAGHAATPQQRLEMVQLACADEPAFVPCDIELSRPPPSYTVDTLRELRATLPAGHELYFMLGADSLADLHRWHGAAELVTLANMAVVTRPGSSVNLDALDLALPGLRERTTLIPGLRLDIASSSLRQRRAAGQPVRYQLPDAVIGYIEQHGLYT